MSVIMSTSAKTMTAASGEASFTTSGFFLFFAALSSASSLALSSSLPFSSSSSAFSPLSSPFSSSSSAALMPSGKLVFSLPEMRQASMSLPAGFTARLMAVGLGSCSSNGVFGCQVLPPSVVVRSGVTVAVAPFTFLSTPANSMRTSWSLAVTTSSLFTHRPSSAMYVASRPSPRSAAMTPSSISTPQPSSRPSRPDAALCWNRAMGFDGFCIGWSARQCGSTKTSSFPPFITNWSIA